MSVQVSTDRGYLNLLSHLRESRPQISLETLQASICHYLVHLPPSQPTPTPLTASVMASPLWHPLTVKTCHLLGNTLRLAVWENLSESKKKQRGLFDASLSSELTSWSRGILSGLKDGDALLRLTLLGGLLLGLNDLVDIKLNRRLLRDVEGTMVLAFAEATNSAEDQWATEFRDRKDELERRAELALLLASQYFNSVSTEALAALNLINLAKLCLHAIDNGFFSGNYLCSVRDGLGRSMDGSAVMAASNSNVERSVDALLASDNFFCIAYLSRLLSRIVSKLADTSYRASKRRKFWDILIEITLKAQNLASRVEEGWRSSPLAEVQSDSQLDETTRKLTEDIWTVLKTQLFSSLMLQQAVLDTILFLPPPPPVATSFNRYSGTYLTSTILDTLSSLSFVISSFGGVTAGPSDASNGPSFPELKKVFYTSIDILATDVHQSDSFIRSLVQGTRPNENGSSTKNSHFTSAKQSFALSCMEQFISIFDDGFVEEVVLPFCEPHLSDPSDRQTYEAAHSVMLSIFATHAEKGGSSGRIRHLSVAGEKGKGVERTSLANDAGLATRLVPGYTQTLIENATEGGLTTAQLRLAYAALVRSSSTGKTSHYSPGKPGVDETFLGHPLLAWFCVEQLLRALANADTKSQTHLALSLTVISCIPSVGPYLLPRILKEVERIVDDETDVTRKRLLVGNVFEEILERVGDAERGIAMKWWFEGVKKWESCFVSRTVEQQAGAKL